MARNSEAPVIQTIGHAKVIWQLLGDAVSVFNPLAVYLQWSTDFFSPPPCYYKEKPMKPQLICQDLDFFSWTLMIYDIGNGLLDGDLTPACNMWRHWLFIDPELWNAMLCLYSALNLQILFWRMHPQPVFISTKPSYVITVKNGIVCVIIQYTTQC